MSPFNCSLLLRDDIRRKAAAMSKIRRETSRRVEFSKRIALHKVMDDLLVRSGGRSSCSNGVSMRAAAGIMNMIGRQSSRVP